MASYVFLFRATLLGGVCLVYFYIQWLIVPKESVLLKKTLVTKSLPNNYSGIHSDKWIVVTTISQPTPDMRFLANIPGWKMVVVGDTKTPKDWSYPNCVFLSIEDQHNLGFETVPYIPEKSYARKSVGYLFAIAHGAKVIYETDDDNRPLDYLQKFVFEPAMWGLLYDGRRLFNPYRHFGQPTLWPRGYPLSAIGENITTYYRLNLLKTPSIQQGVVNGDPDMDAIFRLTRKKTLTTLNVTFDGRAPPAIVPAGVFSPFNSQNTLFLYDALWALLLPTTTTFRVCDIWRGYWSQRLLWEMGGNLGFFPPNAFQKRNSHSYLLDAKEEKDLYFETERLIDYLERWRCETTKSFFGCVTQLSADMANSNFWDKRDAEIASVWIQDLKRLGYSEPRRINFGSLKFGARVIDTELYNTRISSPTTSLTFWAAEQTSPMQYSQSEPNRALINRISKIQSYCKNVTTKIPNFDLTSKVTTFPNILLIVVFNFPHYGNLDFLETMYHLHFPHIVYCGTNRALFDQYADRLPRPLTFIDVTIDRGIFGHKCLTQAIKMNYNVDGYLYIGDDVILNVGNLHTLPLDQLWLKFLRVLRPSSRPNCVWFRGTRFGLKAYQTAVAASKSLKDEMFIKFFKRLKNNTRYRDGFYKGPSDIFYVPDRLKDDVLYFLEYFTKFDLFLELAVPTVFGGIEEYGNIYILRGSYLWDHGERTQYDKYFNKSHVFIHPVKISKERQTEIGRKFFCESYFPLNQ